MIRTGVEAEKTVVIPNAIDTEYYKEIPSAVKDDDKIVIVVLSRLTQRKGVDLLIQLIPVICKKFPQVQF